MAYMQKVRTVICIKITVLICCITPKRCLEVGKYSKMIRLIK